MASKDEQFPDKVDAPKLLAEKSYTIVIARMTYPLPSQWREVATLITNITDELYVPNGTGAGLLGNLLQSSQAADDLSL
jgi:hypothetical protein